jgi:hypothetical protein
MLRKYFFVIWEQKCHENILNILSSSRLQKVNSTPLLMDIDHFKFNARTKTREQKNVYYFKKKSFSFFLASLFNVKLEFTKCFRIVFYAMVKRLIKFYLSRSYFLTKFKLENNNTFFTKENKVIKLSNTVTARFWIVNEFIHLMKLYQLFLFKIGLFSRKQK